jgi:hypothetical protein
MNQNSGVGVVSGTFQSSVVAGQQYRIAVIALRNTTATSALQIDDVYVGPQTAPIGPVVTDWVSYTPTLSWISGVGSVMGRYRRVGDNAEIYVQIPITGSVTAGELSVSLPSPFTFDTNKVAFQNTAPLGEWSAIRQTVGYFNGAVTLSSSNTVKLQINNSSAFVNNTTPATWGNTDSIGVHFYAPIQGWSSSVQMSSDTDTRVVAMSAQGVGGAVTANVTNIPTTSTYLDTHGAWSGSSYTVPISGNYQVFGGASGPTNASIYAVIDGVNSIGVKVANGSNASGTISGLLTNLKAGSVVSFRSDVSQTLTYFLISMTRVSGPSVVAASEVVEATYQSTAGNSMTNGTEMFLDFPTKIRDTHGAVSGTGTGNKTVSNAGWKFTAPITGRYYVNAVFHVTSGAVANSVTYGYIAVNGSPKSHSDIKAGQNPVGDAFGSQINGEVFMNAGDYLEVVGYQANGANRNQQAVGIRNQVEIVRVGAY